MNFLTDPEDFHILRDAVHPFRLEPVAFTDLFLSLQQRLTGSDCDKEAGLWTQDRQTGQGVLWSAGRRATFPGRFGGPDDSKSRWERKRCSLRSWAGLTLGQAWGVDSKQLHTAVAPPGY